MIKIGSTLKEEKKQFIVSVSIDSISEMLHTYVFVRRKRCKVIANVSGKIMTKFCDDISVKGHSVALEKR